MYSLIVVACYESSTSSDGELQIMKNNVMQLCVHKELDRIKFNIIIKFSGGYNGTTRVFTAPVSTCVACYDLSTSSYRE